MTDRPAASSLPLMMAFAAHAMTVGSLFSRIAEIQLGLKLTEAEFGITLMGMAAGVLAGTPTVGRLIDSVGPKRTLLWSIPAFAATPMLSALAFNATTLFAATFVLGVALAICNVAMNVEADRYEAATDRRVMNRCHGIWGVGFFIVTLGGSGAIAVGISPAFHFLALFVVIGVSTATLVRAMVPSPPRRSAGAQRSRRFALPTVPILLIMGFALAGTWLEGAARSWSIIYLRDVFGTTEAIAALSLPIVVAMQTAGRFLADGWIDRFGPAAVGRALSVTAFAGLALVTFAPGHLMALAGMALLGLGFSIVYPQALSAAARLGDRPATENVAALSTLQTLVVFVGPPIFGFIATEFGLRFAFGIALPFPLIAVYFARFLATDQQDIPDQKDAP